jgi:hypothetical protein
MKIMPSKPINEEHVGVFEAVPGSDLWSIRVIGADGRRTVRQVGSYQDAVAAYLDHAAAKRLAVKGALREGRQEEETEQTSFQSKPIS